MAEIAKSWFEFKEDERMKVVIEDGLKYIQSKGLILVHLCHLTRFGMAVKCSALLLRM